ncbi:hypothetical protein B0T24DRAFT_691480 [Lasiosphaeria ovina]|uniref:Uncharacterized protein n=1 Tax=Lasiosphaeria ovina TaxID=92902 RepID=A0AAE0MYZ5_9PEZI|nr:hypothetical protein B0T24DRAFT_691480 [Lasiosphaeria ovina]
MHETVRHNVGSCTQEFHEAAFPQIAHADQERAARLVVKVAFMIDYASKDGFSVQDDANFPVKWQPVQTFVDFIESTFPHDASSPVPPRAFTGDRGLKAWKLKARYATGIVPTNDLVQHLLYDRRTRTLSVFHQTAWLKAQIRHSAGQSLAAPAQTGIQSGTLPAQLLVETLLSIYYALFPLSVDKRSLKLARSLVHHPAAGARFDPNLLVDDGLVRDLPDDADDFQFVYWAERLCRLQVVVANPRPPTGSCPGSRDTRPSATR